MKIENTVNVFIIFDIDKKQNKFFLNKLQKRTFYKNTIVITTANK